MEKQALQKIIDDALELQKADEENKSKKSLIPTENQLTDKDLFSIGEELSIPQKYIQQAIQKYRGSQNLIFINDKPETVSLRTAEYFLLQNRPAIINNHGSVTGNICLDNEHLRNRTDNSLRLFHVASKHLCVELQFQESPTGGTEVRLINLSRSGARNRAIVQSTMITTATLALCLYTGLPPLLGAGVFFYCLLLMLGINHTFKNQLQNTIKAYFENTALLEQLKNKYTKDNSEN